MSLEHVIKTNRPNVSLSSIKTYLSSIKSISKAIDKPLASVEDILKYSDEIFKHLESQKLNVRKTKLSAFIVALDKGKTKNDDETDKVLVKYRRQITSDGAKNDERETKQELTDSQKANFISWEEVKKVYTDLKTEAEPLFKLDRLTIGQFKKLQNYVLLSMYVLIPPRRSLDYADFKLRNYKVTDDNYMLIKGKKRVATFIFNKYKNSSRLGSQTLEVPPAVKLIIQKWTEKNPYDWLIVNGKGNHVTQSKINEILNDIFGKRIGSSMLRHIYITYKYGSVDLQDMKDTAEAMGSSDIERTLKYVSKDDGEKSRV
jgi:hypothetical protein